MAARALTAAEEWQVTPWIALASVDLGEAYLVSGRGAEAMAVLEATQAAGPARSIPAAQSAVRLAGAYLAMGRRAEAERLALKRARESRTGQQRGWEAFALLQLGDIVASPRAARGRGEQPSVAVVGENDESSGPAPSDEDVAQAEAYYRQALALADELGMRPLVAHCHLGLGTLYRSRPPRAGPGGASDCRRDVPRDGDDLLAGARGDRTGADRARPRRKV